MSKPNPLRLFVAMPGTDMGPNASYTDPEAVKANLLVPVVKELTIRLDREVLLSIEKDKRESGVIHESMFAEARDAEVYLADLTGANPNVYLELGVRWALRDTVTVLICQSVEDLKFNVFANRALLYYPDIIIKAIDDVVEAIMRGLQSTKADNPVRLNSDIIPIRRSEVAKLNAEIERLQIERGEDLLRVAATASTLHDRIDILNQVIDTNPASTEAKLQLGQALRSLQRYDEAIETLAKAVLLSPDDAELHRELGVTYSKQGHPQLATTSLREAVRLSPNEPEAWSNLGGALRRVGMASSPENYDKTALSEARECYREAHSLDQFDLYSGLNVCRLDLLLSRWQPALAAEAKAGFVKQVFLCKHMVQQTPDDYWRRFDLADALLFSGDFAEAESAYDDAINFVPVDERTDAAASVVEPLRNYRDSEVIDGELLIEVEKVIKKLDALISQSS